MIKGRIGRGALLLRLAGFLVLFALGPVPSAGAAALSHQFDPILSLTGGSCTNVGALDMEPDPGCAEAPPPATFSNPTAVTTDSKGNIYVASYGGGSGGRIDVFDSSGFFITEIADSSGPDEPSVTSILMNAPCKARHGRRNGNTSRSISGISVLL